VEFLSYGKEFRLNRKTWLTSMELGVVEKLIIRAYNLTEHPISSTNFNKKRCKGPINDRLK